MTKTLLLLTCATSAMALSAGAAMAATDSATDTSQGASSVAELVVVAEHRTTELQKIPVAVSVFTGAQRDLVGINSVQDVTNYAPGFSYDPATVHAYIRGVGRQSVNVTDDQRVASYEDEFYVYSPYGLEKSSLFLSQEQIERGPQSIGGREAAAGSIDMVSVRPTDEPYAEVRATGGNFGKYVFEGAISGQIAPGLDVRLSGFDLNQNDGYYTNLIAGLPTEGSVLHEWYVEGQVDYKPNDNVEFWARGFLEGWNNRGDAGARNGYLKGSWDETSFQDGNAYVGAGLFVNPNFGYAAPASGGGNAAANAALLAANATGDKDIAPLTVSLYNPAVRNNPGSLNPNNFTAPLARNVDIKNYDGLNYILTYHFPGIDFKYNGGVQGYDYGLDYSGADTDVQSFTEPGSVANAALIGGVNAFRAGGVTALPTPSTLVINPLIHANYKENDWWTVHDVSFESTSDGPLQWVAGASFYFQHYDQPYRVNDPAQPNLTNPVYVPPAAVTGAQCPAALGFFCGFSAATPAPGNPNNVFFDNDYTFNVNSDAIYGQASYKFNDQFKVTGNLRYTYDHKWGTESLREVAFNAAIVDGFSPYFGAATPSVDATPGQVCLTGNNSTSTSCASGSLAPGVKSIGVIGADGYARRQLDANSGALTGGGGLEWTPTTDIFVYARYGRGYESMSFNAGLVSFKPEVAPEYLNSYEIGYKENFGRTLSVDIAAFYYDYINIQIPLSVNVGGVTQTQFVNIPKSVSEGVEVEGYWTPVKDLVFSLSYSYDYTAIKTPCAGTVTAGALTANANALCVLDTNDPAAVQPGAKPFAGQTTASRFQGVNGNPLPDAPRNKIAISGAYTWHFDPGSLTLEASYVWRDQQEGSIFQRFYNVAPAWDDVDFRATWKGPHDKYEVIGFVKNAFNTLQYEVGNQGQGLSGSGNSVNPAATGYSENNLYTLAPPRTFGVEVRYKFF